MQISRGIFSPCCTECPGFDVLSGATTHRHLDESIPARALPGCRRAQLLYYDAKLHGTAEKYERRKLARR